MERMDEWLNYYKSYEEALSDIEHGYIFNRDKSFSLAAIPTVTSGEIKSSYVHHDNIMDIEISTNNLFQYSKANESCVRNRASFIKFEIFDSSGNNAFSFVRNGKEIEEAIDLPSPLTLYPGEWKYQVIFAYATNGLNLSNLKITAKYRDIYDDNIQWLKDNKLK